MGVVANCFFCLCIFVFSSQLQADPSEVTAPIEKVYVPYGFDDNDNTEIVVQGFFPNPCYRLGHAGYDVDHSNHRINVWVTSYFYPNSENVCPNMVIPFVQGIKVGILPVGEYQVTFKGDYTKGVKLQVTRAKSDTPDDALYAAVENAFVTINEKTGNHQIILQGAYPYWFEGCQVLKELKLYRQPDVLVVLPEAELVDDERCDSQLDSKRFTFTKDLGRKVEPSSLIHVRVLNGGSVNRMVWGVE
tara:strand:+ start:1610 stop:2347 length:738 start_codon:yes stop_codon:yes gene_type:complete